MTRVMFTGVHGIGKSATAIKLNKLLPSYLYIPSFGGPVAKRMGFDLNQPHTSEQLLAYQERVLDTFIESYKATAFVDTIYDRSPNDIAAYTHFGLGEDNPRLSSFVSKCLHATTKYCDVLVYPEADLTTPMEAKYNRPSSIDRQAFDRLLDQYASRVQTKVTIIDVPKEHQYDDRVNFVRQKLLKCQNLSPHRTY